MSTQATKALLLGTIIHGFEQCVNQSMRYAESHPEAWFADLEEKARQLSRDCFGAVLEAEVEMRRRAAEETPRCSDCGRLMAYKGDQVRHLETYMGRTMLRRGYYYCQACHKGCYRLEEALDVGPGQFSDGVQSRVSRLAAQQPFEAAAGDLTALTMASIAGREVERLSEGRGKALEAHRAA